MNDIEKINDLYDLYYSELSTRMKDSTDKYIKNCVVYQQAPQSTSIPNLIFHLKPVLLNSEDMNKSGREYEINLSIEINTQDIGAELRQKIGAKIQNYVFPILMDEWGFNVSSDRIPNLDTNIHRILMTCVGYLDIESNTLRRNV